MSPRTRFQIPTVIAVAAVLASPSSIAADGEFFGLLRVRDLTPFGFLRLDMRPAHAVDIPPSTLAIETELGYQNTWALSPEVEKYLTSRESQGRVHLGAAELEDIRNLPGENYLVDYEAAVFDLTFHYKVAPHTSAYLIANAVSYHGGFLDSTIEGFHDSFGFSSFGRPAVTRNQVNLIYDLKSTQTFAFDAPTDGGITDPIVGFRYSGWPAWGRWHWGLEGAVKLPVAGRRLLLSTGRTDYGVQLSAQRRGDHHALYVNASAVYYAGAIEPSPQESQFVPTLVLGYEYLLTPRTNVNVQAYISDSVYSRSTTDLDELLGLKYQMTLGVRHLMNNVLFTFAITENLQNINNTPDIGFQLGLAFIPERVRR